MAKITLLDNKPYKYELLDSYYKECETNYKNKESWIAFKRFFKSFTKKVFETNLVIFTDKDMGNCFSLAYSERNSYASISHSLHSITPYVLNEWHLNYKPKESESSKQESEPKNRFVDFWCMSKNKEIEAWIEVKRIWFNFNLKTDSFAESVKKIYDGEDKDSKKMGIIQQGLEQLDSVRTEIRNDRIANATAFKVILLNIPISCTNPKDKKIGIEKINSAPKRLEKLLNDFVKSKDFPIKNYKKSVLCAVLDLDPQGTRKGGIIYKNEYTPYFALGAIVLE